MLGVMIIFYTFQQYFGGGVTRWQYYTFRILERPPIVVIRVDVCDIRHHCGEEGSTVVVEAILRLRIQTFSERHRCVTRLAQGEESCSCLVGHRFRHLGYLLKHEKLQATIDDEQ